MSNVQVNFIDYDKFIEDMLKGLTQIEKAIYICQSFLKMS